MKALPQFSLKREEKNGAAMEYIDNNKRCVGRATMPMQQQP
jgi:hypothetical protein